MTFLHWAIISPFLLAILIPFFYRYIPKIHTGWFVFILPLALFGYFMQQMLQTTSQGGVVEASAPWVPSLQIFYTVYLDGLSILFALLITGIGALVVLYSIYYLDKKKEALNNFYVYLLMFMGAMLGVIISDNMIVLYVFWELTSLSSALLISYWFQRDKSIYGAQKSMLITVFGGFAMLGGFAILYSITGTFSIQETIASADLVMASNLFIPAMILVLLGAFTKSAQFPFHIWLPDAMEAPTPVSAYLHSATMVKAGLYLVARFTPVFAGVPEWFWIVSGVGLFTLFWGSLSAVRQKDLKGILAFSTISQLGLIMSLLGVGSASLYFNDGVENALYHAAIMTAIFHLINHATFKGSLFMAIGIIDHETGTRDINRLGGLMTIMPVTFTITLIGAASMAGIPPFNGFISKEMFFTGMLEAMEISAWNMQTFGILFPVIAWVASIFTFLYCLILFFKTFTGKFKPENFDKHVHEAPIGMLISPIILVVLVIVFGLFPNLLAYSLIEPAMQSILPGVMTGGERFYVDIYLWHGFELELFMTMGVIALGTLLFIYMKKWSSLAIYKKESDILNPLYDGSLSALVTGSQKITRAQITGRLRDYLAYMSIFIVLLLAYTMFRYDAFSMPTENISPIPGYMWVLVLLFILTTVVVPFINDRMAVIIIVGALGFLVAIFFVAFRAPDLALTQFLIETVVVVLFLLAFKHLPNLKKERTKPRIQVTNAIISVGVGVMVTLIGLSSYAFRQENGLESISQYFIDNSYELAAGENMVNVILVDFRGLDTILEVLVLAIAALGVITLIKLRMTGREDV
ncbi:multisubunit sodium/proton antiporter MrpA subunit [Sinobaca qinghaiensis]|uniref:Multisubunit sodium/proton antiporter MrpA subunit n=1 Tax=Sinobaca qinghaiensis TaxID=342944 RepID=A0A419V3R9_9BACL|nr:Na+/H+ antiporter subunit A [Sinobaca qinghaiensis]RKD73061.1 multisubunit sodium/proton antiporter MrpA subunit [Sinobaca qinghaiensis]